MKEVEFYFDFGSPYSYLAYHQLKKITEKNSAKIIYHPVILGGIFKATNNNSPITVPLKARYLFKDLTDWANYWHLPFTFNPYFPINTFYLMRAAIGYQQKYPEQFEHYVATIFSAMFETPVNLNDTEQVKQILEQAGLSFEIYQSLIDDENIKLLAKQFTQNAVDRGIFGAPTFFIQNDMYWGQDRLHFIEQRLQQS